MKVTLPVLGVLFLAFLADDPPAKDAKATAKTVEIGKHVSLEVLPSGQRRVLVSAQVCFREGFLELFMCRKLTKEHESIVAAEIDARDLHKALLAAGAVTGSPVRYERKPDPAGGDEKIIYHPAKGSTVKVFVKYQIDGKDKTVNAREWVRDVKTRKELAMDWVFGGSFFHAAHDDDEKEPKKPKLYAANGGDVVCVSNFGTAMLDLPIQSSAENDELQFEAFTERIPPLGAKVTVIFEPQPEKKVEKTKK